MIEIQCTIHKSLDNSFWFTIMANDDVDNRFPCPKPDWSPGPDWTINLEIFHDKIGGFIISRNLARALAENVETIDNILNKLPTRLRTKSWACAGGYRSHVCLTATHSVTLPMLIH